ncbi:MAG: PspC domain-containing protein [Firmicutes bacterium]|nr:PspC domain-containing protein [Bacillota bacterium]
MKKRLYRSLTNKMIGGVCGGIAEYFDADPTLIRLATALIIIMTGFIPGLLFYIIAWIIMPLPPK